MTKLIKSAAEKGPAVKAVTAVAAKNLTKTDDQIAVAAYFKAEKRHFESGHELDDWFEAKAELEVEE